MTNPDSGLLFWATMHIVKVYIRVACTWRPGVLNGLLLIRNNKLVCSSRVTLSDESVQVLHSTA